MIKHIRAAGTLFLVVHLALLTPIFALADTIVFDAEAEDAILRGMIEGEMQGITHVYADKKYEGSISFTFEVPQAGTYTVEGKTIAPDSSHDSFLVSIDDSAPLPWHVPNSTSWEWNEIETDGAPKGAYHLEAGTHTLTLFGREVTRIDRIKVSTGETITGYAGRQEPDAAITSISGTVRYVSSDGAGSGDGSKSHPFHSIQSALDVVRPGDTIIVADGTYTEELTTKTGGTNAAPITLRASRVGGAIIDLGGDRNGPRFKHSHYRFEGFEVRNFDEGIRIEGATGVEIVGNEIHHGQNECVRVRYYSRKNRIADNRIHFCGATSHGDRIDSGNGEGIYIGTAPEQRSKNSGEPDTSTENIVEGNVIYDVTEGIDVKEDSNHTLIRANEVYDASDTNSGAINIRGDENTIDSNVAYDNAGSGFRFGGDADVTSPDGEKHDYGVNNVVRNNVSRDNGEYGYKVMRTGQDVDCSNEAYNNNGGATNGDVGWCFR